MVNLNQSLRIRYIRIYILIFIVLITLKPPADLQTLTSDFTIPRHILRIYSAIALPNTDEVLIATESSLLLLNLSEGLIREIPVKDIYDLELFNDAIVGTGKTSGKAYILLLNQNMTATSIKYSVDSALYDSVISSNTILSSGYALINSTYKIMITYSNGSEVVTYIADCPSACYGRKLLIAQRGEVILAGSLFLRGRNYQWSYDVFHGVLGSTSLIGSYVSLDGNDYVVNSFLINNTIYTVINSDTSGLHVAVADYDNFNTSLYRILVDGRRVDGVNAAHYNDSILIIAKDLMGDSYTVLLNVSSGIHIAFSLGNTSVDISMANDKAVYLNSYASSARSNLIICDFDEVIEYLRRFNSRHVSLNSVDVFPSTLKLAFNKGELNYEVSTHTIPSPTTSAIATTSIGRNESTSTTYSKEPLYTLKIDELVWGRVSFLTIGIILITSSIILKYLTRIRVEE